MESELEFDNISVESQTILKKFDEGQTWAYEDLYSRKNGDQKVSCYSPLEDIVPFLCLVGRFLCVCENLQYNKRALFFNLLQLLHI